MLSLDIISASFPLPSSLARHFASEAKDLATVSSVMPFSFKARSAALLKKPPACVANSGWWPLQEVTGRCMPA